MSMHKHATLGSIQGVPLPSTTQYRNIPYAKFQGRFREASIQDGPLTSDSTPYDATKWGPLCPQIPNGIKFDFALAGVELPHEEKYEMSEDHGLNLVVTVPEGISAESKIPVVVWIHGGYWVVGGNSWPQYDLQNLVEASVKSDKPVIGVAFNYRLGVLGLVASKELDSTGNFGLKDTVLAFQWLQKNISGFGGDPNSITAFGESAGAMLLSALLQLSTPLFNRALVMSGSATLRPSKTEAQQGVLYNDVLNSAELLSVSPTERAQILKSFKHEDLISKLPPLIHVGPSIEPGFLGEVVSLNTIAEKTTPSWCSELVIGDCFHDASCFKSRVLNHPNNAEYFINCINATLSNDQAALVIQAYELSTENSAEKSLTDCMELLTDLRWYLPILHTISGDRSSPTKISRYHFHQTNNFDCPWKGLAAHLFDITLLLQNHKRFLNDEELRLGEDMGARLFRFAYAEGFLSKQEETDMGEEGSVVWGPGGSTNVMKAEDYDTTMRKGRGSLLKSLGWELCEKLANNIQFGISK